MEWLTKITKSSVQMAHVRAEIPPWQLTYIQCHCYMNLYGHAQQEAMFHTHSHCHKAPPSLSTYGSRWTEIPYNTVLRHTSTLDILPTNRSEQTVALCWGLPIYQSNTQQTLCNELPHGTLIIILSWNHIAHTAFHPPSSGIAVQKDDVNLRTSTITQYPNPYESHIIF